MKSNNDMAQRYAQIINSRQQPVLKNGSFVRYPVKGANADLLIFQDTSSVIEANGVVISSFEKNEKYAHHFCDNLVDIDA